MSKLPKHHYPITTVNIFCLFFIIKQKNLVIRCFTQLFIDNNSFSTNAEYYYIANKILILTSYAYIL